MKSQKVLKKNYKERWIVPANAISVFFAIKETFKKDDVQQKDFLQDLDLLCEK